MAEPTIGGTGPDDVRPITQFCFLWAAAEFFDLICFPQWITEPTGIALFVATMAVLLKPSSSGRFLVMCALDPIYLYVQSPWTPNHTLFKGFVTATILFAALRHWKLRKAAARAAVFDDAASLLRIETILLYFFTFFHKLNWDFLNPSVSCAGFMLDGLAERVPIVPTGPAFDAIAVWGTLVTEGGIGALLLFRRTRRLALLVAWGFHFMLAFHPRTGIYAFSAMLFALLSLFLSDGFYAELDSQIARRPMLKRIQHAITQARGAWLIRALIAGAVLAVAVAAGFLLFGVNLRGTSLSVYPEMAGLFLWIPCALVCLGALWIGWPRHLPGVWPPLFRPALRTPALAMVAVVAVNGMAPYLGWQTVRVLSMFSSLRTEGNVSNHLLVPASVQIADYQTDLVRIVSSSERILQFYAESQEFLPFAELRRRVWEGPAPVKATFERNGQTVSVDRSDPAAASVVPPLPFPLNKILAFRGVDTDGKSDCRW